MLGLPQRYAELSAYSAIWPEKKSVSELFEEDNIDLNQVLADLDHCRNVSGFRFYIQGAAGAIFTPG